MTSQFRFLANFEDPKIYVEVGYILLQKGQNYPYYVPGQKWAQLMKEFLFFDRCDDLEILMTGGLKPEYCIRKRNFNSGYS